MEILKKYIVLTIVVMPTEAWACPACAAANNGRFFLQSLIAVAVMWILPIVICILIGIRIYAMCRLENAELSKGRT